MPRALPACVRAIGRSRGRTALSGACAAAVALLLAGCGTTSASGGSAATVAGSTLDIVVSQPPGSSGGQVAVDVLDAERLGFAQSGAKAGPYALRLVRTHAGEVSGDARRGVSDTRAIAYLGEIEPGTSGISLEITNELGLLQVSPTDTAAYLTHAAPGLPNAPGHFYPARSTYGQTFGRLVPTTIAEASAIVARMQAEKLTSVAVEHDGSPYGISVAGELSADARRAGMTVSGAPGSAGAGTGVKAVVYAGLPGAAAEHALDAAASAAPTARLFAPSALYDDTFVGRLSSAAQQALTVSAPGIPRGSLDAVGRSFVSAFAQRYGHQPAPQAIFGYEAVRAIIAALRQAGDHAAARSTVVGDFRALSRTAGQSAIGAYTLRAGDTSLRSFVFAHVAGGNLTVG